MGVQRQRIAEAERIAEEKAELEKERAKVDQIAKIAEIAEVEKAKIRNFNPEHNYYKSYLEGYHISGGELLVDEVHTMLATLRTKLGTLRTDLESLPVEMVTLRKELETLRTERETLLKKLKTLLQELATKTDQYILHPIGFVWADSWGWRYESMHKHMPNGAEHISSSAYRQKAVVLRKEINAVQAQI